MNLVYFLVSEDVVLDSRSNKVSVLKLVEHVHLDDLAVKFVSKSDVVWVRTPLVACCCFRWEPNEDRAESDPNFEIAIKTPTRTIPPVPFSSKFQGKELARSYIDLPGLPDDGPGTYEIVLIYPTVDGLAEASWPIEVTVDEPVVDVAESEQPSGDDIPEITTG